MQVHGASQVHSAQGLSGPHFRRAAAPAGAPGQPADRVEISAEAAEAARLAELVELRAAEHAKGPDGVRAGLVERLRGEIAAGTYESADKLDAALDRLLDEIG